MRREANHPVVARAAEPIEEPSAASAPRARTEGDRPAFSAWRAIECALVFGVGPALLDLRVFGRVLIPLLLGFGAFCLLALLIDRDFEKRRLIGLRGLVGDLPRILLVFVAGGTLICLFTWIMFPERLFGFVTGNTGLWLSVMLLYPIFSVYPQEIIYRAFFFRRYRAVFREPWQMIVASGVAFGWAHVVLENWIAVLLCTIGGLLFAWTYHRSRSTLAASVEHALYGDLIWTIGLGWFFYAGSVGS